MNRLWLIYWVFLVALLIADIGFAAAKVIWPHPTNRDSNTVSMRTMCRDWPSSGS